MDVDNRHKLNCLLSLIKQAVRFAGASVLGFSLDFVSFSLMVRRGLSPAIANMISSSAGATVTFVLSTRFVFKKGGILPLPLKWAAYIVWAVMLTVTASIVLGKIDTVLMEMLSDKIRMLAAPLSKCIITPFTLCANFFVVRYAIERL